ncbi:MAG: hypothetical protein IPM73_03085 [Betaproteobacteria bacterium]|nr:hypothetical protein [Betaproteobacteria bacterium]
MCGVPAASSSSRTGAFNYGGVTVMLNNLPLDDPDKVGRIRDNIAILAEGADAGSRPSASNAKTAAGSGASWSPCRGSTMPLNCSSTITAPPASTSPST